MFVDKPPIFTSQTITQTTAFPVDAAIRCEILARPQRDDGQAVVEISTVDVNSTDGEHRFEVKADQVFE